MHRTPLRIGILVAGLVVAAGLGYRVFQLEQSLNSQRRDAVVADKAAAQIEESLIDLRASLHAYVAPGQGLPFWAKRAQTTIDTLRDQLKALDATAATFNASLNESLDGLDQITAAERRARTYVSRGDMDNASEVIFTEVRDVLAAANTQVDAVRTTMKTEHDRRIESARQQQLTFAAGVLGVLLLVAVVLTPAPAKQVSKDPAEWRNELKETLKKPVPIVDAPVAPAAPAAPVAPAAPAEPVMPLAVVRQVSEICSDLSALSDPTALEGTLGRATQLLDATGLIVWVASNDASSLSPVATFGFDPKLVTRIGRVPRDSANLTAAAFRENTPKMSAATETAPAALAVTMCGPSGPAGVVSIELKPGQSVDEAKVALASIVAAQLATLAMPVPEVQQEIQQHRAAV